MTQTEQNKATVRDFIDGLFTKGDLGAVDTYLAEDFINHDQRVTALVLQGRSTREIVSDLHLSPHIVQEYVRAAYDKFGVGSRRELIAALLGQY